MNMSMPCHQAFESAAPEDSLWERSVVGFSNGNSSVTSDLQICNAGILGQVSEGVELMDFLSDYRLYI